MEGTLYLCGTPIGNLEDITLRVIRLLKECDFIAAEDTRHTLKLLNHLGITTPMISYHEHNKLTKGPEIVRRLLAGENCALVTDAGMPGISDPGEDLVKLCYENGLAVTTAPGPAAVVTALVLSGFSTRSFLFEGFLPADKRERREVLASIQKETRTMVFYEAPHHLLSALKDLESTLGSRNCACIRELTKRFEEVKKGTLTELLTYYSENPPKGEFVIVLEGLAREDVRREAMEAFEAIPLQEHLEQYLSKGMSEKEAMKAVAKDRGVSKREIYAQLKRD